MKISKPLKVIFISLCFACLGGCFSMNPDSMEHMETALRENNPNLEIESRTTVGVGALILDLIDFVYVEDEELDISKITRAEVGIFELSKAISFEEFKIPTDAFDTAGKCPQWDEVVRVRENDEQILILACVEEETISAISVFVLEPQEIIVVNARGNLDAFITSMAERSNGDTGFLNMRI